MSDKSQGYCCAANIRVKPAKVKLGVVGSTAAAGTNGQVRAVFEALVLGSIVWCGVDGGRHPRDPTLSGCIV